MKYFVIVFILFLSLSNLLKVKKFKEKEIYKKNAPCHKRWSYIPFMRNSETKSLFCRDWCKEYDCNSNARVFEAENTHNEEYKFDCNLREPSGKIDSVCVCGQVKNLLY